MTFGGTRSGVDTGYHAVNSRCDTAPEFGCSCTTEAFAAPSGSIVVLRVAGAIDLLSEHVLDRAVAASLAERPEHLVVDLSAVTFCSVRGLVRLADAEGDAFAGGTRYAVCGLSAHLVRVAGMLWGAVRPARYRTVAAAVIAIRTEQARDGGSPAG